MAEYTKGDWRVHPANKTDVYALNQGSQFIAECGNARLPNGEDLANARLISAAPDLYEALMGLIEYYDIILVGDDPECWVRAINAKTKAEGKK